MTGTSGRWPRGRLRWLAAAVAAGLLAILLVPDSDIPNFSVELVSKSLRRVGAPRWLSTPDLWEPALNVLLFMPVGAVLALVLVRWPVLAITLAGAAASLALETVQAYLLAGRDGSLRDVATNATGTLIGAAVARYARSRRPAD